MRSLLKFLGLQDTKNLRLVSQTLYNLVNENDDALKYVYRRNTITPAKLRQMADDCPVILGVECAINLSNFKQDNELNEVLVYLAKKHKEVKEIKFNFLGKSWHY